MANASFLGHACRAPARRYSGGWPQVENLKIGEKYQLEFPVTSFPSVALITLWFPNELVLRLGGN